MVVVSVVMVIGGTEATGFSVIVEVLGLGFGRLEDNPELFYSVSIRKTS